MIENNGQEKKKLEYAFTQETVNFLLKVLDSVQFVGVQQAQNILAIVQLLQNPLNVEKLQKEQLKELKEKYENKTKN